MHPVTTLRQLSRLRRRERGLRLLWGCAFTWAILGLALGVCCLIDWTMDLWDDTPLALRLAMLLFETGLALFVLGWLIVRPQWQPLSDSLLALWVERKLPVFRERLITAVQLNQKGAKTEGMSRELIEAVTWAVEKEAKTTDFRRAADTRRLGWSALVLVPVGLLATGLWFLDSATVSTLLARQLLADRVIPRSLVVENATASIWPSTDPVTLQFRVFGPERSQPERGRVRLWTASGLVEHYALQRKEEIEPGCFLYTAELPALGESFRTTAWIGDGRTRQPAEVIVEPRPAPLRQQAWVILPAYCGLRPDGRRYEQFMEKGDLHAFSGSSVRLAAEFNKPVVQATVELLGVSSEGAEKVKQCLDMTLLPGDDGSEGLRAESTFALQPGASAYRLVLRDRHGFTSKNLPRRSILVQQDEPPRVMLLPGRFARPGQRAGLDDTELDGMPVPVGRPFWTAFRCRTPTRLDKARFRYRTYSPGAEVKADSPPWNNLPLTEWKASAKVGAFDLNLGTFEKMSFLDEIEFHAIASVDPEAIPGRHEGGGRFAFKTAALPGLKAGDKIEFFVEVQDSRPIPLVGRSEVRVKDVVEARQLAQWLREKREETRRLQQLEARQRGLFEATKPNDP